jgi:uncharacterized protein (TIGR02145 family)
MNTILNSPQKTSRFKISASFLTCALFLVLTSCQKTSFEQDPSLSSSAAAKKDKAKQEGLKDIDGNVYKTVKIGEQVWMSENLKVTKYNDGTEIPLVEGKEAWEALSSAGYCWYNNDYNTYGKVYGALYNWWVVGTGKLCPTGWHVPTDAELTALVDFAGGEWVAGGKLKETGLKHWLSPNDGASDEFGFTALPGGARTGIGTSDFLGTDGHWWSSSEDGTYTAWLYYMSHMAPGVYRILPMKYYGVSVRCLKD